MRSFIRTYFMIFWFLCVTLLMPFSALAVNRVVPENREQVMLSYAPLVKKALPAVVNIYTAKRVRERVSPFLNDPFFSQFFSGGLNFGLSQERVVNSLGSGVIVDPSGLIITNYHVVQESQSIKVVLSDKRELNAKVVLKDPRSDLVLLKIEEDVELPYLRLSDSDDLQVGDVVFAIGNPFGVGQTVTSGIVSATARTNVGVGDFDFFIQTDAAINPGNSGGALIDMKGRIAGINTAIFTKSGGAMGIGFATPSNMVRVVLESYHHGSDHVIRPWLGASTQDISSDIADSLGLDRPAGVLVRKIHPSSPASVAGLRTGDVIAAVDDHPVQNEQDLKFRIATYSIGSTAKFLVLRDNKEYKLEVKMRMPPDIKNRKNIVLQGTHPLEGAVVTLLTPALAEEMSMSYRPGFVIVEVPRESMAARFVQAGDFIDEINGYRINSPDMLNKTLSEQRRGWNMKILRGEQVLTINIMQ